MTVKGNQIDKEDPIDFLVISCHLEEASDNARLTSSSRNVFGGFVTSSKLHTAAGLGALGDQQALFNVVHNEYTEAPLSEVARNFCISNIFCMLGTPDLSCA